MNGLLLPLEKSSMQMPRRRVGKALGTATSRNPLWPDHRRKINEAESANFTTLIASRQLNWSDPLDMNNPLEQFSRIQGQLGSLSSKSDKVRKQGALFAFNGLVGLAIGLTLPAIGLIKGL